MIIKSKKNENFTVIYNKPIQDKTFSLKAKGLYSYLMTLPRDWEIYLTELPNHSADGYASIKAAAKELIDKGYLVKNAQRHDDHGRIINGNFDFYDTPQVGESGLPESQERSVPEMAIDIPDFEKKPYVCTTDGCPMVARGGRPRSFAQRIIDLGFCRGLPKLCWTFFNTYFRPISDEVNQAVRAYLAKLPADSQSKKAVDNVTNSYLTNKLKDFWSRNYEKIWEDVKKHDVGVAKELSGRVSGIGNGGRQ